jgi:hypothetical protein
LTMIHTQQEGPVRVGKLGTVQQQPPLSVPVLATQPVAADEKPTGKKPHKPAADHPWRKPYKRRRVA